MRSLITLLILGGLATTAIVAQGQDRHDWQDALGRLHPGERIRLTLKSGSPQEDSFLNFTPQDVTMATSTAKREDVLKIERLPRGGGGSRGKHAAIGALIGFGAGFAIGALARGGCSTTQWCFVSRGELGGAFGGVGAIVGAASGALIPGKRSKELIYSAHP